MERYADELAAALRRLGCAAHPFAAARPLPWLRGRAGALANYGWRSTVYPLAARSQQRDLNHILDQSYAHLIRALDPRRTVVTCHDLAPLALDEHSRGPSRRLWDLSLRGLRSAALLIADSAFVRDEIIRRLDYPAHRITVVPLAVSPAFLTAADPAGLRREMPGRRPLILHVGSCRPRKNVEAIVQALSELGDLEAIFSQIGGQFTRTQRNLIRALDLQGRVRQISAVSERDLHTWYQSADVFVLPSLYEGFGLPILEAMAAGTPVVCANTGSLPEVAGEAALMFDPGDPHALPAAIRSVLTDPDLRRSLIEKGRARCLQFGWEETARRTMQVYERVAADARLAR